MDQTPQELGLKYPNSPLSIGKQNACLTNSIMGTTWALYSLYFVANLMVLFWQIMSSQVIAFTVVILMWMSTVQLSSLERMVPKYLKLSTTFSCTFHINLSFAVTIGVTHVLTVLGSILYSFTLPVNLLVRSCNSLLCEKMLLFAYHWTLLHHYHDLNKPITCNSPSSRLCQASF